MVMKRPTAVQIGDRIREARENLGLRQVDLAPKCGIRANALARYEQGNVMPSSAILAVIAYALSVSADTLLGLPGKRG